MIVRGPVRAGRLPAFLRPLLASAEVAEVLLAGAVDLPADDPRVHVLPPGDRLDDLAGDVVVVLDGDVLAAADLAGGHARAQERGGGRRIVIGYAPFQVRHERSPGDVGARLRSHDYEARCATYERDPGTMLAAMWTGSFSLARADIAATGLAGLLHEHPRLAGLRLGRRCRELGISPEFDRSLGAVRIPDQSLDALRAEARAEGEGGLRAGGGSRSTPLLWAALTRCAGSCHLWGLQDRAARGLWLAETRAGASARA